MANPRRGRARLGKSACPGGTADAARARARGCLQKTPIHIATSRVDADRTRPAPPPRRQTLKTIKMQFAKVLVALAAGAAAFTAPAASKVSKVVVRGENPNEDGKLGAGGMADTRDPEPFVNETDKRQSISQAPSFEEYLKSRQ